MLSSGSTLQRRTLVLLAVLAVVALGALGAAWAARPAPTAASQAGDPRGPARPDSTSLVISQVYGGGGNSGAPYSNDFIELFNPQAVPITMNNWSVQYASGSGTTWSQTIISGTIPAGGYFLIQEAVGASCNPPACQPLPAPDATGTIAMSATTGKVALVTNSNLLVGGCPSGAAIIDFVGY